MASPAPLPVSVIINTLNRAEPLERLLQALDRQTYSPFEVVVVPGPCTDRTPQLLQAYAGRCKIVPCPVANLSHSRNLGIAAAAGALCLFIDDDALPCDEDWIGRFARAFAADTTGALGALGGPVKHADTEHYEFRNGYHSDYVHQLFNVAPDTPPPQDGHQWFMGIPGGNCALTTAALRAIGGFDERYPYYLDESDVCTRLCRHGRTVANLPENFIRHYKLPSGIRRGPYDLRWDVIACSDVYFGLKNGADRRLGWRLVKTLRYFPRKHFVGELWQARRRRQVSRGEWLRYLGRLGRGVARGIVFGLQPRRTWRFAAPAPAFRPWTAGA